MEGSRAEVSAEKRGRGGDLLAAWLPGSGTRIIALDCRVERNLGAQGAGSRSEAKTQVLPQ